MRIKFARQIYTETPLTTRLRNRQSLFHFQGIYFMKKKKILTFLFCHVKIGLF